MRIWPLLTHSAGLTYGFHRSHVTAVFLTQLLPSSTHPIRTELKVLVD